jgi:uncharacterized membrane protein
MSPITRRVLQAVLYEVIAIAVVGPEAAYGVRSGLWGQVLLLASKRQDLTLGVLAKGKT